MCCVIRGERQVCACVLGLLGWVKGAQGNGRRTSREGCTSPCMRLCESHLAWVLKCARWHALTACMNSAHPQERVNLQDDDLNRLLHSLCCTKFKLLNKAPESKTISKGDTFRCGWGRLPLVGR